MYPVAVPKRIALLCVLMEMFCTHLQNRSCNILPPVQAKHGGIPANPYRRCRDTTWAPDISHGALFPPPSHSDPQHPSLNSQQLHSGASAQSGLQTGESMTMTRALRSGHRTGAKLEGSNRRSSRLKSSSGLHSGDSRTHPELTSALLNSREAGIYRQASQPAALHSGNSMLYPMLHTAQHGQSALHSGTSFNQPDLKPAPVFDQAKGQLEVQQSLQGKEANAQLSKADQQRSAMGTRQQPSAAAVYTGDSGAQPMLSASTPDRQEMLHPGHHASPSCDSQQAGAERGYAYRPAPTGPPSTVSRNGRIVERAAKVS